MTESSPVLEISGLKTYFRTEDETVKAVDDISLSIARGQTLGLVGESGSGKSVTSLSVMRLLPKATADIESGKIVLLGRDLVQLPEHDMQRVRGAEAAMIFQEPGTSLNPVYRVGDQVAEAIQLHQNVGKFEALRRTVALFEEVGIPEPKRRIDSFPFEMSGGQKQRVMIAMALSCNPQLLIADEPTTALDVTIQAQILHLIRKLRDERGMAVLFITHDLSVIAEIADHVAVMLKGRIVETGTIEEIFASPQHPYTKGLIACRPRLETDYKRLPTVADYMTTTTAADGSVVVNEKPLSEERINDLTHRGRGRLLHPAAELERVGYPFNPANHPDDTRLIGDDVAPFLSVKDLCVYFPIYKGIFRRVVDHVRAVDGVSFDVYPGQTLGLVGESGCGKTTTGRALLRLIPHTSGTFTFAGQPLSELSGEKLRLLRRRIQIIFQDPYSSLNPRMTVEAMLTEPMRVHRLLGSYSERRDRAAELLREVDLPPEHLRRYPHEFSGGQRQRLGIARALAVEPEFIVCDESVSALDVSVQAQVLNLLKDLQEQRGLTYIFISHDLSVVKFMSDIMAVMNDGKFVEFGPSEAIYADPQMAYTKRLIAAIPDDSIENIRRRQRERVAAEDAGALG